MKIAYIMRGVPGSGKSTLAKQLVNSSGGAIHSTDDFFMVEGVYRFDPSRFAEYHEYNYEAFCRSLDMNVPIVVCDNTNVKRWQFKRYVEAAKRAGYMVALVTMPHPEAEVARERCIHGVPIYTIRRMIAEWES